MTDHKNTTLPSEDLKIATDSFLVKSRLIKQGLHSFSNLVDKTVVRASLDSHQAPASPTVGKKPGL